jgi:hypothetical protein
MFLFRADRSSADFAHSHSYPFLIGQTSWMWGTLGPTLGRNPSLTLNSPAELPCRGGWRPEKSNISLNERSSTECYKFNKCWEGNRIVNSPLPPIRIRVKPELAMKNVRKYLTFFLLFSVAFTDYWIKREIYIRRVSSSGIWRRVVCCNSTDYTASFPRRWYSS